MSFFRSRPRSGPIAARPRFVLAVGQRAFVHSPAQQSHVVFLTNEHGIPGDTVLRDGSEIEVVAWRPRGLDGTRYRIRGCADGADGWLAAEELRTTAAPATPDEHAATAPAAAGRPFGGRT
jgi:hypothetical protein